MCGNPSARDSKYSHGKSQGINLTVLTWAQPFFWTVTKVCTHDHGCKCHGEWPHLVHTSVPHRFSYQSDVATVSGSWVASGVHLIPLNHQECLTQRQQRGTPTEDKRTHRQRELCHQGDRGLVQTEEVPNTEKEVLWLTIVECLHLCVCHCQPRSSWNASAPVSNFKWTAIKFDLCN